MKPVAVVAGTRPEIIKMAPVIRALSKAKIPSLFIQCGQHYDFNMAQQFIENLGLPNPDFAFKIEASSAGAQTAEIMMKMDHILAEIRPSILLVEGDTNSVLASAMSANKRVIPVGHVEAGLRSFDLRMPEEHNRRLTDHLSEYLFAPTERAKANLLRESVWGKIYLTGNTAIDAVLEHLPTAEKKSDIMSKIPFETFALATAHRAENVDNLSVLESFMDVFSESPIPIVYPMHPRTKRRLQENRLLAKMETLSNVLILPPLGYLDFLVLMKNCRLIITDSGGIQEEATAPSMRKLVLVMRLSTERPEAVEAGFARVVGTDKKTILAAIEEEVGHDVELPLDSPFGDGTAGQKIVKIIKKIFA
ncbi:MAG TPA: UDP-N-acetylglucosamine 2-epimerase (non-hydrolyzing) [Candidatus Limnocylindrales bacterium]|nr:UDP-N-acetylglucosamine 2-epimerase (non-hydrolyzing) [Candidatus Limnocylindrales bacterium]